MWQPDGNSLEIVVDLLKQAQSNDNTKQKAIYKQFNELSKNPELSNYLIYILSLKNDSSIDVLRQTAGTFANQLVILLGVVLKGVIERVSPENLASSIDYIQKSLFATFEDQSQVIRSTVTFVMASLSMKIGHKNWPALIKFLGEILLNQSAAQEYVESSLDCILKIVEDIKMNSENIEGLDDPQDPLNQLIPILIQIGASDVPWKIKALTIECLNAFTFIMSPVFLINMQKYMEILFYSGDHTNETVRLRSCQGFYELLATRKDLINQHLIHVIERIVKFTMDSNKDVLLASLKFWNEFIKQEADEDDSRIQALKPYLQTLVPLFVENCKYSEEDLMNLDNTKSKNASSNSQNVFFGDDEEEDGIQEHEDEDSGQDDGEWTLRRECAHQLDMLARTFGNIIFEYAQEKIANCLQAKDWQSREAGMLAIGAVAKGAEESITPHLNDLYPFLLQNTENENPLVKLMAIWTISRFTRWVLAKASENINIFKEYFIRVLKCMLDDYHDTHKAACTAFSKICNSDTTAIVEYLSDILEVLKAVAEKYKAKQAGSLYDVLSTIASNLDESVVQSEAVETVLITILVKNWEISTFDDAESNMLIECTDTILGAVGNHIYNYLEFFVPKLLILIANYLKARQEKDSKTVYHKREISLRCLEVYSSIIKTIKGDIEKYINPQDFTAMIGQFVTDKNLITKQWILSTIGETAKYAPNLISGNIKEMLQFIADNLSIMSEELGGAHVTLACCNNASWALGLVCSAFPKEANQYIPELIKRVVQIISGSQKLHLVLAQNLSVAIGRMALSNSEAVAQYLPNFLKQFCLAIEKTREEEERNDALKGLFWTIAINPNGIVNDFHFLCLLLTSINPQNTELFKNAYDLVHNFKTLAGNQWSQYYLGFPIELQQKMKMCFGIEN